VDDVVRAIGHGQKEFLDGWYPMSNSIFGHMEASLESYLNELATESASGDDRAVADLGRYELPRVIAALRALLDDHRPDEQGRCQGCRTRLFGRPPAPCRVYLTAHLCLLVTEDEGARSYQLGTPG
jgi:hypothetical protein